MIDKSIQNALENKIITEEEIRLIEEYSERLASNNVPIIFNLRHLRKILKIRKTEQGDYFGNARSLLYTKFSIPKKSGGEREIEAPIPQLKKIQRWINDEILYKIKISESAKGFRKNTCIYHNAEVHKNNMLVINIDLKNFFPSITSAQVYKIFRYVGYTTQVALLLTKLCTNDSDVLPQGSPASPALSNIACLKLDKRLSCLATKNNMNYSRYADDLSFSGGEEIKKFIPLIIKIINEEGYEINKKKLRLQYANQRQEVTGLIVNSKVNVSHKIRKELGDAIYYCGKFGVINHMKKINCNKAFYKEHLYGLAYYVKMVDKEKGQQYISELDKISWLY